MPLTQKEHVVISTCSFLIKMKVNFYPKVYFHSIDFIIFKDRETIQGMRRRFGMYLQKNLWNPLIGVTIHHHQVKKLIIPQNAKKLAEFT